MTSIFLIVTLFTIIVTRVTTYTVTQTNNLHTALFTGYNNLVRPSELVDVKVQLNLFTVNELDIKTQTLTTSGWLTVIWNDTRLLWTPASYGNVDYIYVTDSKIWRPELVMDNSVNQIAVIQDDNMLFKVKYDGEVRWEPPEVFSTHCEVDITWFPFDKQKCNLELTSWAYTVDALSLTHYATSVNVDNYKQNGEWDLITTELDRKQLTEDGETLSQLEFILSLERKATYYMLNVIFPVVLTSVLITIVFLLPTDSGERISYALTVLLALAVLLTIIASNMPTTSVHTSVLAIYLVITLGASTLSVIFTVLVLRLHHSRNQDDVPKWLQRFTMCCLTRMPSNKEFVKNKQTYTEPTLQITSEETSDLDNQKIKRNHVKPVTTPCWDESESKNNNLIKDQISFHYTCSEVGEMVDNFLFLCFTIFTILVTFIFLLILGVGA